MNNRLGLFRNIIKNLGSKTITEKRKLYTDQIYPYPFNYINNKIHPSRVLYRESWPTPPWTKSELLKAKFVMRGFWTYMWWSLFWDPGAAGLVSHVHLPDPETLTDAELGIPPDEYGSYKDWLKNKQSIESQE